jgi:hypothetical protein
MRRVLSTALVGIVSCLGIGLLLTLGFRSAEAQPPPRGNLDVIMMRCAASSTSFEVSAYRGSTAAPDKKSDNCPEELSLLMKDGFEIDGVGYFDQDSDFIVYTLKR